MRAENTSADSLLTQLTKRHPDSAPATASRVAMEHEEDDFVRHLSPQAAAVLATCSACRPGSGAQPALGARLAPGAAGAPVLVIPPDLGEEILAFADYALLDALHLPAVEAIMHGMSLVRAVTLLDFCCAECGARGAGYALLRQRCAALVATQFATAVATPAYRKLCADARKRLDVAMQEHVRSVLTDGTREGLQPLESLILAHIHAGHLAPAALEKSHVSAWLSQDASQAVWEALIAKRHNVVGLIMRGRARAFRDASSAGRADLVMLMWEITPPLKRDALWTACGHAALRGAIRANHAATVAAILARLTPRQREELGREDLWNDAVASPEGAMVGELQHWLPTDEHFLAAVGKLAELNYAPVIAGILGRHPDPAGVLKHRVYSLFRKACIGGHVKTVQVLLRFVPKQCDFLEPMLLAAYNAAVCAPTKQTQRSAVRALLAQAAHARGQDLCAAFDRQPDVPYLHALGQAAASNDVCFLEHVLARERAGMQDRSLAFIIRMHETILSSASRHARHDVVKLILAHIRSPAAAASLIIRFDILLEATAGGDPALVATLIGVARHASESWACWLDGFSFKSALYAASGSHTPEMLSILLETLPQAERSNAILEAGVATRALEGGFAAILRDVFKMAKDDAGFRQSLIRQMVRLEDEPPRHTPLGLALVHKHTSCVHMVLDQLDTPAQRKQAMTRNFAYLCCTDPAYFFARWVEFSADEQTALLTESVWRYMLEATPDIAAYLVRQHPAAFIKALGNGPDVLPATACATVRAIVENVAPREQARILRTLAPCLVRTASRSHDPQTWKFLQQRLSRAEFAALTEGRETVLLAADMERILLSDPWLTTPEGYNDLVRQALQDMVDDDNVTLCRELLAHYPEARDKIPQPLHRGLRDLWLERGKTPGCTR